VESEDKRPKDQSGRMQEEWGEVLSIRGVREGHIATKEARRVWALGWE
jgi:hypothetical protein